MESLERRVELRRDDVPGRPPLIGNNAVAREMQNRLHFAPIADSSAGMAAEAAPMVTVRWSRSSHATR